MDAPEPALVDRLLGVEHRLRRPTGTLGMVFLGRRGAPHRHQFVADVIDEHPLRLHHLARQLREDVADPLHRHRRSHLLRDAAKTDDVAEQDRDGRVAPREEIGLRFKLGGELGGEELRELHLLGDRLLLLLDARQARRQSAGERFDEEGFEWRDVSSLRSAEAARTVAVESADDVAIMAVDNRRSDVGLDADLAHRDVPTGLRTAPQRLLQDADTLEHRLAVGHGSGLGPLCHRGPAAVAIEKYLADVELDEAADRLGRLVEELIGVGGALEDRDHVFPPLDELVDR